MNTVEPLQGVGSIKVKLGLLVGVTCVVAALFATIGERAARLALLRGPGGWRFCARVRREGRELAKDEVELLEEWLELRSSSISKDPGR